MCCGGIFDYENRKERLTEVELELADSKAWEQPERAQKLGQERAALESIVATIERLDQGLSDAQEIVDLAVEEQDQALLDEAEADLQGLLDDLDGLEFQKMFSGPVDANNAYLEIQSGFKAEIIELSDGDVAGIKCATVRVSGSYAFGWLRTETGVHRLVRKSPFDSGNRRHTSFASVFLSPELDENIDIELDMSEIRVDTYRSSGAGGQHVNKTDSAVRLTHLPSGTVVQCQNQRSQHKNRDQAIKQLKAKLYEIEQQKRKAEMQQIEDDKSDISWGSQIRSYVLDASRIKDLRTNVETANTQAVLDGDLDPFIEASLKQGL
jgi:peptide chain release factor 2